MIYQQQLPLSTVQWVIVDDSPADTIGSWIHHHPVCDKLHSVLYKHMPHKVTVGAKRNVCKSVAAPSASILLHMDDDDYYGPGYMAEVVRAFQLDPHVQVVGASKIQLFYPDSEFLWVSGPFHTNHTCGATMSYRQSYAKQHLFPNTAPFAEGRSFLDNYTTRVKQISNEIMPHYFAVSHASNTVNKYAVARNSSSVLWASVVSPCNMDAFVKYYSMHRANTPHYLRAPHMLIDKSIYKVLTQSVCRALLQLFMYFMTHLKRFIHR